MKRLSSKDAGFSGNAFFTSNFSSRTEHVVKLIGMVTTSLPVLVLMEFMENGDLECFLRKRRQGSIFLKIRLHVFLGH